MLTCTHYASSSSDDDHDLCLEVVPNIPRDTATLYHVPININRFERYTGTQHAKSDAVINQNTHIIIDLQNKACGLPTIIKDRYQRTAFKDLFAYVDNSTTLSAHNIVCTMVENLHTLHAHDRSRIQPNNIDIAQSVSV